MGFPRKECRMRSTKRFWTGRMGLVVLGFSTIAAGTALAGESPAGGTEGVATWLGLDARALAIAGAAIAVILAGIGSSIGIGFAGQASLGAMTEDTKNFARYLMLSALPGTQGIYGFVVGFLTMTWALAPDAALTLEDGLGYFLACLPIGFAGLLSAVWQGKVCSAGVGLTVKRPEDAGKALVLGVFVEFYAVLGLLISFLLLLRVRG